MSEEDEQPARSRTGTDQPADNSLGRLLTLSDGIFAISMTLLALDLQVPDLGGHPSDASLRDALAANSATYWSFLLTFYVVAGYWRLHRRLVRSVVTTHPALIRDTLALLLFVAAMPFPASLLGRYGGEPISLAIYGAVNALATLSLIVTSADVRRLNLADGYICEPDDYGRGHGGWISFVVFLLAIPAGYVLHGKGPYVLLLLIVPDAVARIRRIAHKRRAVTPAR